LQSNFPTIYNRIEKTINDQEENEGSEKEDSIHLERFMQFTGKC
jgi:hypothetical protein